MNIKYEGEIEGDKIELTFSYIQKPIFATPSGMQTMQNKQEVKENVFMGSFILKKEKDK
ncbi:MAG: hypothetical protein JW927_21905 [Deltaproteobacteria bacterium]|nr:hypothetical protein [Deltaproteobacteria bacterium]